MSSFTVAYRILAEDGFSKAFKRLEQSSKTVTKSFKRIGDASKRVGRNLSLGLTLPITAAFGLMTKEIIAAEETLNKFSVVFRDIPKQANAAFNTLRKDFGLGIKTSKALLSQTGDLLTGFGFAQEEALKMSLAVNKLAVDLASFTNIEGGVERASLALTKGLLGERESMKLLGIAVNENTEEFKVLVEQIQATKGASLLQAKALATLRIATKQSKNAIGDYARTSASAANQFRLFKERMSDLAITFQGEILPTVTKVITKINKLIMSMSKLKPETRKLILIFGGIAAALGPIIFIFGSLMTTWAALIPIAATLGVTTGALSASILLIPLAITAVIVAIVLLIKNWDKVVEVVKLGIDFWIEKFKAFGSFVGGIWDNIVTGISQRIDMIIEKLSLAINKIKKAGALAIKFSPVGGAISAAKFVGGKARGIFQRREASSFDGLNKQQPLDVNNRIDQTINVQGGQVTSSKTSGANVRTRLGRNMGDS